jgi:hypothetical protein
MQECGFHGGFYVEWWAAVGYAGGIPSGIDDTLSSTNSLFDGTGITQLLRHFALL